MLPEACAKLDLKVRDTIQTPGPEYAGQINALWRCGLLYKRDGGDGIVSNGAQGTLAFELRPEEHCQ